MVPQSSGKTAPMPEPLPVRLPRLCFSTVGNCQIYPKSMHDPPFFSKASGEYLPWRVALKSAEQPVRFAIPIDKRQSDANIEPPFSTFRKILVPGNKH